jgi:hypothetical protein
MLIEAGSRLSTVNLTEMRKNGFQTAYTAINPNPRITH